MSNQTVADSTGGQGAGPGVAELTTTADLRFEIGQVLGWIERAEVLAEQLKQWRDGLPERYEAAAGIGGPQTQGLTTAIGELLEAQGRRSSGPQRHAQGLRPGGCAGRAGRRDGCHRPHPRLRHCLTPQRGWQSARPTHRQKRQPG
jgi:hypothetical protein